MLFDYSHQPHFFIFQFNEEISPETRLALFAQSIRNLSIHVTPGVVHLFFSLVGTRPYICFKHCSVTGLSTQIIEATCNLYLKLRFLWIRISLYLLSIMTLEYHVLI